MPSTSRKRGFALPQAATTAKTEEPRKVIAFPSLGGPKRAPNIEKEGKSNDANSDQFIVSHLHENLIKQFESGLLSKNSLYDELRELWGSQVFEGTLLNATQN